MTVEEIFNKIASHMVEGIMYHDEFAKAYDFLGLYGYAKCHDFHHFEEELNYRALSHYYATHYFKLLQLEPLKQPELITATWLKYSSQAVDINTKRNAIKELTNKWIVWEQNTKRCYSEMYKALIEIDEVAAALKISKFLSDVDKELHIIQKKLLELEAINYDLTVIIPEQKTLRDKYKRKIKKIL